MGVRPWANVYGISRIGWCYSLEGNFLIIYPERSEDVFTFEKGQEQHYAKAVQVFFWDIAPWSQMESMMMLCPSPKQTAEDEKP